MTFNKLPTEIASKLRETERQALEQWATAGTVKRRWIAALGGFIVGAVLGIVLF